MSAPHPSELPRDLRHVPDPIRVDDMFAALKTHQRRVVMDELVAAGGDALTVEELVNRLDHCHPRSEPAGDAQSPIRVRLQHVDLPKLADMGLINWDREQSTVEPTDALLALAPLVDLSLEL